MLAQRQRRLVPVYEGGQPELIQPRDVAGRVRRRCHVDQRGPAPLVQRLLQRLPRRRMIACCERTAPLSGEPGEPVQVDEVRVHGQPVAGPVELDHGAVRQRPP